MTGPRAGRRRLSTGTGPILLALAIAASAPPLAGQTAPAPPATGEGLAPAADGRKQEAGSILGTVAASFEGGSSPLAHATVQAAADGRMWATSTDAEGRYRIDRLPPGEVVLRASYPGHAPVELVVAVPAGAAVDVDLELRTEPIRLSPLRVEGSREEREIPAPGDPETGGGPALPEIELQSLDLSPGVAQDGLLDAIRGMPGNEPIDPTDVLFMRGSTTDLKLVLLDGVPVHTPFHVGGLLRTFEPAVLGSADLHVGGAPARYDGGLTHILDLRTRSARRDGVHASGSVDLLTASGALEAPLGPQAGVIASARTIHDFGDAALGGRTPYGYRDVLVSLDGEPAPGHELRATGFWNSETVLLSPTASAEAAEWGNFAGSGSWTHHLERGPTLHLSAGASGYRASLPLQAPSAPGDSVAPAVMASGGTQRVRLLGEAAWGSPEAPWRAGVSYERIDAAYQAIRMEGFSDPRRDGRTSESRGAAEGVGAFLETTRTVAPGFSIRAGLRADAFSNAGVHLAPRAALLWDLGPRALLTLAAGRYHQPTRTPHGSIEETLSEVAGYGIAPADVLPVAAADHVVLSLRQRLGERVDLDLGGFWKRYTGLRAEPDETVLSSGLDMRVLSAGEHVSGWLGYGLSWFWSGIDLSGRTTDFAGRHLLSMGLAGSLPGPLRGEARMSYAAGLPYTSIPLPVTQDEMGKPSVSAGAAGAPSMAPGPASGGRTETKRPPLAEGLDQDFLRIDLELYAVFEPKWGGRRTTIRPYLRILNALDRRDALFYSFEPWRGDALRPLAERTLLPLLGLAFTF